jgi:hypothetical protein
MLHKYIRYEEHGLIIWPVNDIILHVDIANTLLALGSKPLSAGFAKFIKGEVCCYGSSNSLNVCSQEDDSHVLSKQLGRRTL